MNVDELQLKNLIKFLNENQISFNWINEKTKAGLSRIEGTGRFATDTIEKDETVVVLGGICGKKPLHKDPLEENDQFSIKIADDIFMYNLNTFPRERSHVNHSCQPNLVPEGNIVWRARQQILSGDEITIDYGCIIDGDNVFIHRCNCGNSECRKTISGKDWMMPLLQNKYKSGFIAPILKKIIEYSKKDYLLEIDLLKRAPGNSIASCLEFVDKA